MAFFEITTLFRAGDLGYATFRIPGLVRTPAGTLLAYCEARRSQRSDWCEIDTSMRRGADGGRTWSPPTQLNARHPNIPKNPVARQIQDATGQTCGSPVIVADRSGAVHFIYCVENAHCFYRRSLDDGQTWTEPVEITTAFEEIWPRYPWRVFATGPGHGIELSGGRLLFTAWLSPGTGEGAHRPSAITTLYSDDHGDSWHTGTLVVEDGPLCANPSESAVVERPDGQVLINIRTETPVHHRLVAASPDGSSNWSPPFFETSLFEPVCCAGFLRQDDLLLFSNPDSSREFPPAGLYWPRRYLTLRVSRDFGRTWPEAHVIDPGMSGYSDLAPGTGGNTCCLYESGGIAGNAFAPTLISLAKIRGL